MMWFSQIGHLLLLHTHMSFAVPCYLTVNFSDFLLHFCKAKIKRNESNESFMQMEQVAAVSASFLMQ